MLNITENAKQKLLANIKKQKNVAGIKVGVKPTGCSGFSYTIDYTHEKMYNDIVVELNEFNIYIDPGFVPYLEGLTIDYVKKGLNETFEFINPNEKARCGCGESFII